MPKHPAVAGRGRRARGGGGRHARAEGKISQRAQALQSGVEDRRIKCRRERQSEPDHRDLPNDGTGSAGGVRGFEVWVRVSKRRAVLAFCTYLIFK